MIIVRLTGGLGNQLFQYAAARSIACRLNTKLKLDISIYRKSSRNYQLKYFNIAGKLAKDQEIRKIKSINIKEQRIYHYNPDINNIHDNSYLIGFWHSEKFFTDIEPLIRKEFTLKHKIEAANQKMANRILNCEAVMLHVRRGDYVTKSWARKSLGARPLDYYYQAVNILKNKLKAPHFFIFSDDWTWVKNHLKIDAPATFVTLNNEIKCYQDLFLMSLCKHFIIANSTFSWWGAWLSTNKNKIIFYPKQWFKPGAKNGYGNIRNTQDLIPDSWKRGFNSL